MVALNNHRASPYETQFINNNIATKTRARCYVNMRSYMAVMVNCRPGIYNDIFANNHTWLDDTACHDLAALANNRIAGNCTILPVYGGKPETVLAECIIYPRPCFKPGIIVTRRCSNAICQLNVFRPHFPQNIIIAKNPDTTKLAAPETFIPVKNTANFPPGLQQRFQHHSGMTASPDNIYSFAHSSIISPAR